jgi:capsular polysaccharide biosynthesis protein
MSRQALDLRRSAQIVRRHRGLVGAAAAFGLVAAAALTALDPPAYAGTALVALSPATSVTTQEVVAASIPVIELALPSLGTGISPQALHGRVQAERVAAGLMSVSVRASSPALAVKSANAVARSYVAYANSAAAPGGQQPAQVFQFATDAVGTTFTERLLEAASAGIPAGALVGAVIALALGQNDERLRERDEIADSIGVPVLGSVKVQRPARPPGWAKLLEDYRPEAADAWQYRRVMRQLEVAGLSQAGQAPGRGSVTVLSLASDRAALALGPQLAAFAAAQGMPTALLVGPGQDTKATAALRAACAAPREATAGPGRPHLMVTDDSDVSQLPDDMLTIVVAVVDDEAPRVASTMRTSMTVLGVASGAVTAQQLARAAASAAGDGRDIAGILVANPDAADQTTGRRPQLARSGQHKMPTRTTSAVTEIMQ